MICEVAIGTVQWFVLHSGTVRLCKPCAVVAKAFLVCCRASLQFVPFLV